MSAYTPAALRTQQLMAIVSSVEPAAWARVAARAGAPADQNEYQGALVDLWRRADQADRASAESVTTAVFGNGLDSPEEINSELVRHEETVNRALNELAKSNTIPDAAGATRAAITAQQGFGAYNSPITAGAAAFVEDVRKRTMPIVTIGIGLGVVVGVIVLASMFRR